jgi:hypothetical protein
LDVYFFVDLGHQAAGCAHHLCHFGVRHEAVDLVLQVFDLGLIDAVPFNVFLALQHLARVCLLAEVVGFRS